MHPDISEFSYGYALTEELIHSSGLPIQAAPIFPSLIEEGQPGGGYDVQVPFVGVPLFLQFKLADCMVRRTAFEVQQGLFEPPFFRMRLRPMKHSQQHRLLLDLEQKGRLVFYAVPHFHKPDELNNAYLNRQVIDRSVFFKPSQIGPLPDDDHHHVSFRAGSPAYLCSEPRLLLEESKSRQTFDNELVDGLQQREVFSGTAQDVTKLAQELIEAVRVIAKPEISSEAGHEIDQLAQRAPRLQIAYLARAFFGCEIVLVRRRQQ